MNKILNYLEDDNWYKIFDAENEEDIEYKLLEREEVQTLLKEIERLQDRIARANNFIDQVMLYRIPNKTKEVYVDIETLQNILNGSEKE